MLSLYSSSTIKASFHSSFPPLRSSPPPLSVGSHIRLVKRDHSVAAASGGVSMSTNRDSHGSSSQVAEPFFRSVLGQMETVYLNRNPTPRSVLELVRSVDDEQLCYDHLAFRTFGIGGYGIDSLASFFLDYGYTQMDELRFPAKKLRALWFAPPHASAVPGGSGVDGPLPRVFISELLVEQMSTQTQDVIRKYTETSPNGRKYAALSSALGSLPWEKPLSSEFEQLARESEYAAWTLANGYALNHVTISVHRLKSHLNKIKKLNQFLEEKGFRLNSEGGVLKVLKAFRRKNQGISSTMLSLYSSSTIKASFRSSFPPLRSSPPPLSVGSHIRLVKRDHSVAAASGGVSMSTNRDSHGSSSQVAEPFFRSVLGQMETVYLNRNPTPRSVLELVRSVDDEQLCYDHLAFRTFGIGGYGIDSLASFFLDYGYTQMDELRFPAKKLRALWFAPPHASAVPGGSGVDGPLPRVFISELLVEQMSTQTQDVIRRYTETSPNGRKYAALSSALGSLPWEKPLSSEFEQLARESEYAAWTLANGYALNHVTISVHRLKSHLNKIKKLNQFLEEKGFRLNSEGGVLK
ncbi:hypothetical protein F2Q69_00026015, partial [Brassica cretica]